MVPPGHRRGRPPRRSRLRQRARQSVRLRRPPPHRRKPIDSAAAQSAGRRAARGRAAGGEHLVRDRSRALGPVAGRLSCHERAAAHAERGAAVRVRAARHRAGRQCVPRRGVVRRAPDDDAGGRLHQRPRRGVVHDVCSDGARRRAALDARRARRVAGRDVRSLGAGARVERDRRDVRRGGVCVRPARSRRHGGRPAATAALDAPSIYRVRRVRRDGAAGRVRVPRTSRAAPDGLALRAARTGRRSAVPRTALHARRADDLSRAHARHRMAGPARARCRSACWACSVRSRGGCGASKAP